MSSSELMRFIIENNVTVLKILFEGNKEFTHWEIVSEKVNESDENVLLSQYSVAKSYAHGKYWLMNIEEVKILEVEKFL